MMKEDILMMGGGDASVQQQYLDTVRRSELLEPEKALLVAILEDAIHTYRKYKKPEIQWGNSDSAKLKRGSWRPATNGFSHLTMSVSC